MNAEFRDQSVEISAEILPEILQRQSRKIGKTLTLMLFGASIFCSAFLLFQVQPIIGKFVLPWFGGSPGVWTTCMLFFQVTLFAGYAYAHALQRLCSLRCQILLHSFFLFLATATLPITPGPDWKPQGNEVPAILILQLLAIKVGAAYFLLSSTGPLLQSWLGRTNACASPYRLYALSNLGSMLALLSFPFLVEPVLSSLQQSAIWSWLFGGFVLLCSLSGFVLYRDAGRSDCQSADSSKELAPNSGQLNQPIRWSRRLGWFSLSALASMMLLSTTNQLCVDTGALPFLWIMPLSLYLLSFILTFDSERWYNRRVWILLSAMALIAMHGAKLVELKLPLSIEIGLYCLNLLACCMVCHGELVGMKPSTTNLTAFYLTMSAGGACGGLFVGLIAPLIFRGYFEWQLALLACIVLFIDRYLLASLRWRDRVSPIWKLALVVSLLLFCMVGLSVWNSVSHQQLTVKRNFYGVLSVNQQVETTSGKLVRKLVHGRIVHGTQFEQLSSRQVPTAYYTSNSGVGLALTKHKTNENRKIGIVGLGAGTLAAYGQTGDSIRFYEINPDVIELAQSYFSFIQDSKAQVEFCLGDARLMLERENAQHYDLLVLDAFSGDAIPVHLLTAEAMETYARHLRKDGILAIHISNLYFDLKPVVSGLAQQIGYQLQIIESIPQPDQCGLASTWVLMSSDPVGLRQIHASKSIQPIEKPVFWTDDNNNLFELLY